MDANGFERLIDQLRTFTPRSEVMLTEVPAPQKLATFAFATLAFATFASFSTSFTTISKCALLNFLLLSLP
jgi:hypothetical protein